MSRRRVTCLIQLDHSPCWPIGGPSATRIRRVGVRGFARARKRTPNQGVQAALRICRSSIPWRPGGGAAWAARQAGRAAGAGAPAARLAATAEMAKSGRGAGSTSNRSRSRRGSCTVRLLNRPTGCGLRSSSRGSCRRHRRTWACCRSSIPWRPGGGAAWAARQAAWRSTSGSASATCLARRRPCGLARLARRAQEGGLSGRVRQAETWLHAARAGGWGMRGATAICTRRAGAAKFVARSRAAGFGELRGRARRRAGRVRGSSLRSQGAWE